jgi:uracil-DNA glycosylase
MYPDTDSLTALEQAVIACARCPRLRTHRERVAREKVRRFAGSDYWGKPVPGFGDSQARLLVLGLAPAAHGGNRTGRVFTGDRRGE